MWNLRINIRATVAGTPNNLDRFSDTSWGRSLNRPPHERIYEYSRFIFTPRSIASSFSHCYHRACRDTNRLRFIDSRGTGITGQLNPSREKLPCRDCLVILDRIFNVAGPARAPSRRGRGNDIFWDKPVVTPLIASGSLPLSPEGKFDVGPRDNR